MARTIQTEQDARETDVIDRKLAAVLGGSVVAAWIIATWVVRYVM